MTNHRSVVILSCDTAERQNLHFLDSAVTRCLSLSLENSITRRPLSKGKAHIFRMICSSSLTIDSNSVPMRISWYTRRQTSTRRVFDVSQSIVSFRSPSMFLHHTEYTHITFLSFCLVNWNERNQAYHRHLRLTLAESDRVRSLFLP